MTTIGCHFMPGQQTAYRGSGVGTAGDVTLCHNQWGTVRPALTLKWGTVLLTLRVCVFGMVLL